jgi:hypothetical protein
MNQIDLSPVDVFCHRMSAFPSPLKSPVPAIDHAVGTCGKMTALLYVEPFINQIERSPVLVFCQSIRINGAAVADSEPARGAAVGEATLRVLAAGALALSGPATGEAMLI